MIRIIIAEDEPLILLGFQEMVKSFGFEVVAAVQNGQEAIDKAIECRPDLVIMDINMPVVDGLKAAEEINKNATIPIIIITGYRNDEYIKQAVKNNISAFLQKPVDEYELKSAILLALQNNDKLKRVVADKEEAERKLEERKVVERAKGVLMDQFGLSEAQAMKALQKKSANENKKLFIVAKEIIKASKIF